MLIVPDNAESHLLSARAIKSGGAVAFRTDTFYGLGVDPFNARALELLNDLKGREGKPILVVISDLENVARLVSEITPVFKKLTEAFWPGPLTVVAKAQGSVPEELTAGTGQVGVRLPDDERVRAFVRSCGGALTATSANPAGATPARSASEVESYFADTSLLVVDGGETTSLKPSTVVEAAGTVVQIIREGVIERDLLVRALQVERLPLK